MISRDCVITVNGNTATIDSDIYLYKYDKNVQLSFEIINSKYMYDNDDSNNLIKSMQAAYAQVKFKKNDSTDIEIEFDIQATRNGAVVLTINEELTDEDTELGDYTIQIRLLDSNKTSVVTLPPVESCIHIQAPLFEKLGAGTNVVNKAVANKAIATYAEPLSATVEDGTFNSKTWVDGDKITTAELNRMEKGIKTNSTQYKDIANKTVVEDGKLYLVKNDGTKLDNGTTLPTSSGEKGDPGTSVTISSIVESTEDGGNNIVTFSDGTILNVKNGNKGSNGTGISTVKIYDTEPIGELFNQPSKRTYLAWCPGNIKYDKNKDKFACIVNACEKHVGHTVVEYYLTFIDGKTFESTELVQINNALGIATTENSAICCFNILPNGDYIIIAFKDGVNHKFISTDNGTTWTDSGACTGNTNRHFWQIIRLSNGRLIGSCDVSSSGFYYSDDEGISWTNIKPANELGNYNEEAYFFELGNNKIMAIARKNAGGQGTASSGDSDNAIISYSTDNGTTWSAWQESTTIKMNASSCTGVIHDGIIELFTGNRWYHKNSYACTEYTNTGKNGAIRHYTATIENALNDNFTDNGIVVYANTPSDGSDTAQDFHSPAFATDGKNGMIMYFDRVGDATKDSTNHYFVRCSLGSLSYAPNDKIISPGFSYSSKYVENLFGYISTKIATLQYALSQIPSSGVDTPTGQLIWTNEYDVVTKKAIPSEGLFFDSLFNRTDRTLSSTLVADSENLNTWKIKNGGIMIIPTKENFALEMLIQSSTSVNGSAIGLFENGQFYGVGGDYTNTGFSNNYTKEESSFFLDKNTYFSQKSKIRIVKNGGKVTLTYNDIEYDCDAWSTLPKAFSYFTTSNIKYIFYFCESLIYNLKYGEWDS